MYYPVPVACGVLGALLGLCGGGLTQCYPVWVGAATGGSIGCVASVVICLHKPDEQKPVIVQNVYIVSGNSKDLPVAQVVT